MASTNIISISSSSSSFWQNKKLQREKRYQDHRISTPLADFSSQTSRRKSRRETNANHDKDTKKDRPVRLSEKDVAPPLVTPPPQQQQPQSVPLTTTTTTTNKKKKLNEVGSEVVVDTSTDSLLSSGTKESGGGNGTLEEDSGGDKTAPTIPKLPPLPGSDNDDNNNNEDENHGASAAEDAASDAVDDDNEDHEEEEEDRRPRRVVYFDIDWGGLALDDSPATRRHNTRVLSQGLAHHGSDATIICYGTFHFYNGIRVQQLRHAQLQIDGAWYFHRYNDNNDEEENTTAAAAAASNTSTAQQQSRYDETSVLTVEEQEEDIQFMEELMRQTSTGGVWANPWGHPPACFTCHDCYNITLTSTMPNRKRGLIHGGGPEWWGIPFVGYMEVHENRPYLMLFNGTKQFTMNNVVLQDSPFYTVLLTNVEYVHIYDITIVTRRTQQETHSLLDLSAFNTDGFDIAGHHVHVHDVDIWNQDDCIAIKDNLWSVDRTSYNMTFERIYASGLGLTIGSIAGTTVRDITFRDCYLYKTYKGIYLKFRRLNDHNDVKKYPNSLVENILYENITMESPLQWPIWIGPAQQTGGSSSNICHASPCSLCWPTLPMQTCRAVSGHAVYRNITLVNVTIRNPQGSPGVIMGGDEDDHDVPPIYNLTFHNVVVVADENQTTVDHDRLTKLFPALTYPVHDRLARNTMMTFYLIVLLLIVLFLAHQCYRRQQRKRSYWASRQPQQGSGGGRQRRRQLQQLPIATKRHPRPSDGAESTDDADEAEVQPLSSTTSSSRRPDEDNNDLSTIASTTLEVVDDELRRVPTEPATAIRLQRLRTRSDGAQSQRLRKTNSALYECFLQFLALAAMTILTVSVVLLTIQLVYWIWLIPNIDAPDAYFVCRGVAYGVATGTTYPVPHCLEDRTIPHKEEDEYYDDLSSAFFRIGPMVRKQVVVGLFLLTCWILYMMFMLKMWRRGCTRSSNKRKRRRAAAASTATPSRGGGGPPLPAISQHSRREESSGYSDSDENNKKYDDPLRQLQGNDVGSTGKSPIRRTGAVPPPDIFINAWSDFGAGVSKFIGTAATTEPETEDDECSMSA
ncbi:hypothetical protein ACA910_011612 [Epithemia clementina (nom. ined.)]